MLNTLVRKLIEQLMKFGIVGVIAFVIDWGILNLLVGIFHMHNVLAATISFIISLIFNYLASMKFVFKHRDDMARWMEVLIFVAGAVVGLFMNDAIIWISTYGMNHAACRIPVAHQYRQAGGHRRGNDLELLDSQVAARRYAHQCDEPSEVR